MKRILLTIFFLFMAGVQLAYGAFPVGWGRKCELVIQSSQVVTDCTDYPVLITEDTLPSEIFDADGSYPALNGGGDIRFSSNADGSTQLPCEIEQFVTDNDPANGKASIWVKRTLSSASNTSIWIWYNKAGESQPAEDNAYGKENVWDSNFKMVQHMNQDPSGGAGCIVDSTLNDNDGTPSGMDAADLVVGQIDGSLDFDGDNDYVSTTGYNVALHNTNTFSIWASIDAYDGYGIMFVSGEDSGASKVFIQIGTDNKVYGGNLASYVTFDTLSAQNDGVLRKYDFVFDGVNNKARIYLNGVQAGTEKTYSTLISDNDKQIYIGKYFVNANYNLNGIMDEVRISNVARSAGWIETEYNNQYGPATFIIEGTPETPSASDMVIPIVYHHRRRI